MTRKYAIKTTKYDQFIDLKKLYIDRKDTDITLNHCKVIFDEQGLEHIKGINSLKIKASKIYATQKALAMLYSKEKIIPIIKIIGNYIEEIPHTSKL